MIFIGIDPGLDGGIAFLEGRGVIAYPMPTKPMGSAGKRDLNIKAVYDLIQEYREPDTMIVIEKAQARPGNGAPATFNFGLGFGKLIAMVEIKEWRFELVTPQAWKKIILAGTPKDKEAAIAFVKRMFPKCSLLETPRCTTNHDGMADAVCMAEYGRRTYG